MWKLYSEVKKTFISKKSMLLICITEVFLIFAILSALAVLLWEMLWKKENRVITHVLIFNVLPNKHLLFSMFFLKVISFVFNTLNFTFKVELLINFLIIDADELLIYQAKDINIILPAQSAPRSIWMLLFLYILVTRIHMIC